MCPSLPGGAHQADPQGQCASSCPGPSRETARLAFKAETPTHNSLFYCVVFLWVFSEEVVGRRLRAHVCTCALSAKFGAVAVAVTVAKCQGCHSGAFVTL